MFDDPDAQVLPASGVFRGIIDGNARVRRGSDLEVKGIISGNLIIEAGSRVVISGIVSGRVIDQGGDVELTGIIG